MVGLKLLDLVSGGLDGHHVLHLLGLQLYSCGLLDLNGQLQSDVLGQCSTMLGLELSSHLGREGREHLDLLVQPSLQCDQLGLDLDLGLGLDLDLGLGLDVTLALDLYLRLHLDLSLGLDLHSGLDLCMGLVLHTGLDLYLGLDRPNCGLSNGWGALLWEGWGLAHLGNRGYGGGQSWEESWSLSWEEARLWGVGGK